jgi:hypothetical protein
MTHAPVPPSFRRIFFACLVSLFFAAMAPALFAQGYGHGPGNALDSPPIASAQGGQTPGQSSPCLEVGRSFGFGYLQVRTVSGCPFSAAVEIVRNQTLADGTHVATKSKALVYRDSSGRVEYQSYLPTGMNQPAPEEPNMVLILDPVSGFSYTLFPQQGPVAYRHGLNAVFQRAPARGPASDSRAEPEPKVTFERLGTQQMDGLVVIGQRVTRTYPAGAVGNDAPITVTSETWRSDELGLIVVHKDLDPRTGDHEIRVTSITRVEPAADLFQVPADYTFMDQ